MEILIERGDYLFLTPQNMVEFWSVATRPRKVNGLGMTPREADREVASMEALFPLLAETPEVYPQWRRLVAAAGVSGRQVHDARLAAVMAVHSITRLLTFNVADFKRYPRIVAIHPLDVEEEKVSP